MELQEAITARYSCRSFTERAIDSALLKTCVETAGLAPSDATRSLGNFTSSKTRPW